MITDAVRDDPVAPKSRGRRSRHGRTRRRPGRFPSSRGGARAWLCAVGGPSPRPSPGSSPRSSRRACRATPAEGVRGSGWAGYLHGLRVLPAASCWSRSPVLGRRRAPPHADLCLPRRAAALLAGGRRGRRDVLARTARSACHRSIRASSRLAAVIHGARRRLHGGRRTAYAPPSPPCWPCCRFAAPRALRRVVGSRSTPETWRASGSSPRRGRSRRWASSPRGGGPAPGRHLAQHPQFAGGGQLGAFVALGGRGSR